MTLAHIAWRSDPMKVRLAIGTLSASSANAIEYLMNEGYTEFAGAEHTVEFTRNIDDMFNVLNSTISSASKENILKIPMSAENTNVIRQLFDRCTEYIKGLQIKNENGRKRPLCTSINKTGFQGTIVNMCSVLSIYTDLADERKLICHLPVQNLSQDHLERAFGKLRSLNGSNNNPTCQQFNSGMRKLLANAT